MLGMGDAIFARDVKIFKDMACPMGGAWFGNFVIGSKLQMGVIKKQDFVVTGKMVKYLLMGWDT